jgi:hypothetical protein
VSRPELFATLRSACAEVARRARFVSLDAGRLERFGSELVQAPAPTPSDDPAHLRRRTAEETLAFVLTLDAVNFGSGWFPHLRKRPGRSGYFTVALALAERFDADGPWSAAALRELEEKELARVLGQDPAVPEVAELLGLYARALRDLGAYLLAEHAGRFAGPIEAARGSAARLVACLAAMPCYRDVSCYGELEVPFYKRAQITAADLHLALGGEGLGRFADLDELTLFADNLVPHVLRLARVLVYDPGLARRIDAGELLAPGSAEEVEIRACALHAVERLVEVTRRLARPLPAWRIDEILWARGQRPEAKAVPRHRTRTVFY